MNLHKILTVFLCNFQFLQSLVDQINAMENVDINIIEGNRSLEYAIARYFQNKTNLLGVAIHLEYS